MLSELRPIIDRFNTARLFVVGDLILDHYIWGDVNRTSPEAPVVVVEVTEEGKRLGGAGNVAHNLSALGAKVSVCGVVGDDLTGREMVQMLGDMSINVDGVVVDRSRPTTNKTRVIAHRQQVVRIDRETTSALLPTYSEAIGATLSANIESHQGIIISDYGKGAINAALIERIRAGYASGLLGKDKVPVLIDPKEANFSLYSRATVIKPNRGEAERAAGKKIRNRADALEVGRFLRSKWDSEMVLVTLGEDGMVLVSEHPEEDVEIDTLARDVYDVSGAGDTVSAVFLLALACGADPAQAALLSNLAAGIVVGKLGTAAITKDELTKAIDEWRHP